MGVSCPNINSTISLSQKYKSIKSSKELSWKTGLLVPNSASFNTETAFHQKSLSFIAFFPFIFQKGVLLFSISLLTTWSFCMDCIWKTNDRWKLIELQILACYYQILEAFLDLPMLYFYRLMMVGLLLLSSPELLVMHHSSLLLVLIKH